MGNNYDAVQEIDIRQKGAEIVASGSKRQGLPETFYTKGLQEDFLAGAATTATTATDATREAVKDATAAYKHEQDLLADYLEDHCSMEITDTIPKGELREDYEAWCRENKVDIAFPGKFRASLLERGITDYKGTAGKRYWKGIRLLTSDERM